MAEKISRRTVVASAALIPVSALTTRAQAASVFTDAERKMLEAFVDRLVPKDDLGPGAVECGAVSYIETQLAGALAAEKSNFTAGLASIDAFAKSAHGHSFADLSPDQRDAVLTAMDTGAANGFANARAVFSRIRRLTLEGMFSDPHYGGNTNFGGWDLIRYPGPRVAVGPAEQSMTGTIKPYRKSAWGVEHAGGPSGDAGGIKDGH
jgi:gluconate 2-dehydrogenase gamma chain